MGYDADVMGTGWNTNTCYLCGCRTGRIGGICYYCQTGASREVEASDTVKALWAEGRATIKAQQDKRAELDAAWAACKTADERTAALRRIYGPSVRRF
jgi:hypothetical protein